MASGHCLCGRIRFVAFLRRTVSGLGIFIRIHAAGSAECARIEGDNALATARGEGLGRRAGQG